MLHEGGKFGNDSMERTVVRFAEGHVLSMVFTSEPEDEVKGSTERAKEAVICSEGGPRDPARWARSRSSPGGRHVSGRRPGEMRHAEKGAEAVELLIPHGLVMALTC